MSTDTRAFLKPAAKHWPGFVTASVVVSALLYLTCRFAPTLPTICVGLAWALLSSVAALGLAYRFMMRKIKRQVEFAEDGQFSKLNNGRTFTLIAAFVVSAVCMASLILEASGWTPGEWLLAAAVLPLFILLAIGARKGLRKQFDEPFLTARTTRIACLLTSAVLCLAFVGIQCAEPRETYSSLAEAFAAMDQPLGNSPSALLSEAGVLLSYWDALVAFALAKVGEASDWAPLLLRAVFVWSAFFAVANLVGTCSIGVRELRRVFLPLGNAPVAQAPLAPDDANDAAGTSDASPSTGARPALLKCYLVLFAALPLLLTAGFAVADQAASNARETQEYSAAQQFVRDVAGVAVYVMDGKYYDQLAVEDLIAQATDQAESLNAEAQAALVPVINQMCDQQIANVDGYLDWYYSLFADYERLVQIVTGTVEEAMAEQLTQHLGEGVDESALYEKISYYTQQADQIQSDLMDEIAKHEVTGIPDWLANSKGPVDIEPVAKALEPTESLMTPEMRAGISAGAGVGAGFAAKKLTQKALAKPFFTKIVKKVAGMLGWRLITTGVGTAVGTVVPVVGNAVGFVAGTAVGVGADFATLKIDEAMNRESYKAEIVEAIEETRSELLAMVQQG